MQRSEHFEFQFTIVIFAVFTSIFLLYLYCFFGKIATDSYYEMGDRLFESNWPDLPNDLQKYFIHMINNAQKPHFYHGFNLLVLDLGTFTDVSTNILQIISQIERQFWFSWFYRLQLIRKVAAYYMMFKTITSNPWRGGSQCLEENLSTYFSVVKM